MHQPSEQLLTAILAEIRRHGPVPFARFMERCLYHPKWGYYTRGIGGGGGRDYHTSSGTHAVYGTLLARQADEMWRRMGKPERFVFVEYGPGEGWFAVDFLHEAVRLGGFGRALQYLMVEVSPVLRDRQRRRIANASTGLKVDWLDQAALDRMSGVLQGCLFANEVLDAFPVHRVVRCGRELREVHVGEEDGRLIEMLLEPSSSAISEFLSAAGIGLEDRQEVDLNLAAAGWMERAVRRIGRGYVVVVDYGFEAAELYHPARRRGTLLAYHRHRVSEDFLNRPGEQDLTAHVDFSVLKDAAVVAGGRCLGLVSQAHFLLSLGGLDFLPDLPQSGQTVDRSGRSPGQILREREALKDLVLPDRAGGRFRVLVTGIGDVPDDLAGLQSPWHRAGDRTRDGGRQADRACEYSTA